MGDGLEVRQVALADQMADEAVNGLVPRAVQRVITPGTIVAMSAAPTPPRATRTRTTPSLPPSTR
ncbi:MAG: hypothetical protein K6T35_03960, partial [Meiothermus silvanus]|nr:hypothetical protein [Allomeiothermus silvanus]